MMFMINEFGKCTELFVLCFSLSTYLFLWFSVSFPLKWHYYVVIVLSLISSIRSSSSVAIANHFFWWIIQKNNRNIIDDIVTDSNEGAKNDFQEIKICTTDFNRENAQPNKHFLFMLFYWLQIEFFCIQSAVNWFVDIWNCSGFRINPGHWANVHINLSWFS